MYDGVAQQVYAALTGVVVASPLPEASWYSAAEAAITAIYALHPAPEHLSGAILKHLARAAFAAGGGAADGAADGAELAGEDGAEAEAMQADAPAAEEPAGEEAGEEPAASEGEGAQQARSTQPRSMHSVVGLSRFFFALGHVALQHLVSGWEVGC